MADVDDGDILRLGAGLSFQGVYDIVNVWHVIVGLVTGKTWAESELPIQNYVDELYDFIKATLNDDMGTNVISVANVTQATTIGAIAYNPTWAGTEGGEPTAPGNCCFTWGRTYAPRVQIRKYFGVFGEAGMAAGVWNAGVQDACEDSMDWHIAERIPSAGWTMQGIAYNRALGTHEFAHSVGVAAEPAYQRRRKRGRGS